MCVRLPLGPHEYKLMRAGLRPSPPPGHTPVAPCYWACTRRSESHTERFPRETSGACQPEQICTRAALGLKAYQEGARIQVALMTVV